MFKSHLLQHVKYICRRQILRPGLRSFSSQRKSYDPLRILFCGADEFSIFSLRAVHELQRRRPECVASIDVVCRPDKRVGRGLKKIQEGAKEAFISYGLTQADASTVPIKDIAKELELPIHQIDTFTGWTPPLPTDLVIAVSFGLLVPSRILKGATYGGLNVHPSMLPDLRGPAPIQHALLKGRTHTGVTLQTMHPSRFDHGMILAQTPQPGVGIAEDCTPDDLIQTLGQVGAEMLVKGIEHGLFVDPSAAVDSQDEEGRPEHAPKILPEDRRIDWKSWTADQIMRYDRVLGRLWDMTTYQQCDRRSQSPKRVTFDGPWRIVSREQVTASAAIASAGIPQVYDSEGPQLKVLPMPTVDGYLLTPSSATIEGEQRGKGLAALVRARASQG